MPTKLPIEITYRGMRNSQVMNARIHQMVESKLLPVCGHINRCDVTIEKAGHQPSEGKGQFRVQLAITVPPSHDVVVSRTPSGDGSGDELLSTVQDAFRAARRRLKKMTEMQRRQVKSHPEQQVHGVVRALDGDEGEIETAQGEWLPFHINAVPRPDRESLKPGAGVTYTTKADEGGWRASTVRVIDGRGEAG